MLLPTATTERSLALLHDEVEQVDLRGDAGELAALDDDGVVVALEDGAEEVQRGVGLHGLDVAVDDVVVDLGRRLDAPADDARGEVAERDLRWAGRRGLRC